MLLTDNVYRFKRDKNIDVKIFGLLKSLYYFNLSANATLNCQNASDFTTITQFNSQSSSTLKILNFEIEKSLLIDSECYFEANVSVEYDYITLFDNKKVVD